MRKARSFPLLRSMSQIQCFSKQLPEKFLRQILGVFGRIAAAPDIGVERKPVGAADFLHGPFGLRCGMFCGFQHDGPACGNKNIAMGG